MNENGISIWEGPLPNFISALASVWMSGFQAWFKEWALIWSLHNLKNFFAGIPQGPSETSPGTIEIILKRVQGPPARGF